MGHCSRPYEHGEAHCDALYRKAECEWRPPLARQRQARLGRRPHTLAVSEFAVREQRGAIFLNDVHKPPKSVVLCKLQIMA
jgi:hypothetical protein